MIFNTKSKYESKVKDISLATESRESALRHKTVEDNCIECQNSSIIRLALNDLNQ